jgi:hypothetical protein
LEEASEAKLRIGTTSERFSSGGREYGVPVDQRDVELWERVQAAWWAAVGPRDVTKRAAFRCDALDGLPTDGAAGLMSSPTGCSGSDPALGPSGALPGPGVLSQWTDASDLLPSAVQR